jgi:hypothetical protein
VTSPSNLRARIAAGEELVAMRGDINWSKDQLAAAWQGGHFDLIWLDSQHSPYSDQSLIGFTGAAEQLGIPVPAAMRARRLLGLVTSFLPRRVVRELPDYMLSG